VAARQGAPVVGAQGSVYVDPHHWQLTMSYRWQNSDRHFRGVHEEANRQAEESEVINDLHLWDFAATYQVTERFSVSLSVPVQYANRSSPLRDANGDVVDRSSVQASGIGDISLVGRWWLLKTTTHPDHNASLGWGVKFPTGDYDATDNVRRLNGTEQVVVDQSIQPGDGGYGAILDLVAFKRLFEGKLTAFATGTYLMNPENKNGARTGRSRAGEEIMSVADQYVGKVGLAAPVTYLKGLALSLAARIEGVPVHDAIGGSDGFRRPGYAISIEPGLIFGIGKNTFAISAPVALQRNRQRSVSDQANGVHGDAAFADYVILVSYSRSF